MIPGSALALADILEHVGVEQPDHGQRRFCVRPGLPTQVQRGHQIATSHPANRENGDAENYCARFAIFASRFAAFPIGSMLR